MFSHGTALNILEAIINTKYKHMGRGWSTCVQSFTTRFYYIGLHSQDSSPAAMGAPHPDYPAWLDTFMQKQTDCMSAVLEKHLSKIGQPEVPQPVVPQPPPKKKVKPNRGSQPPESPDSHPRDDDDDDDFDRRFGHLIGHGSDMDEDGYNSEDGDKDEDQRQEDNDEDDDTHSVDDDLLVILDKVPNWDTGSSIRKFITDYADIPLPEDMLKKLNEDYIPKETIQAYFSPPEMPSRLYRAINRMKSKGAIKTERAIYSAQSELFIIAKPLLAALIELRPLGTQVSTARELLSISLRGIFSVSLKLSKARRENVKFLFKEALAETLYSYAPRTCSLFGGDSFCSQVEKAAKEAKIDISWSKNRPSAPYQPFRNAGQGFRYTGGANQYFYRQQQRRGRRGNYRSRGRGYGNNNYNKGYQKPKGGSGGTKKE